jgi:hypothetical protein
VATAGPVRAQQALDAILRDGLPAPPRPAGARKGKRRR